MHTIQPCTSLRSLSKQHTQRACLFGCILPLVHFWQNDRDLLRATPVTLGRNGYRTKSQHRKLPPEKEILPPLLPGFESETFGSGVRRSTTELPRLVLTDTELWQSDVRSCELCGGHGGAGWTRGPSAALLAPPLRHAAPSCAGVETERNEPE